MSSIYKKGRDGYFYYQAYVFNPLTGKKDKRIFHSLGTKDIEEARRKQIKFDAKYDRKKNDNYSIYKTIKNYKKDLVLIISTFLITLFFSSFWSKKDSSHLSKRDISYEESQSEIQKFETYITTRDSLNKNQTPTKDISNKIQGLDDYENNAIDDINILPKYKVKRVESLSGAFEQGKIFVNVEAQLDKRKLLLICEKIASEHSNYSNIIICIYDDSEIGHELAMGLNTQIAPEKHMQAWLAMYTHNPVEGPYFDDNPGSYLGSF